MNAEETEAEVARVIRELRGDLGFAAERAQRDMTRAMMERALATSALGSGFVFMHASYAEDLLDMVGIDPPKSSIPQVAGKGRKQKRNAHRARHRVCRWAAV